ncbi:hypothetical protein [Geobacter sp.]|uniref:hypothetical protein n=1 Tax=Geobacter sp. TaxID=46610 RepID=UPI0026339D72|nr:hypothetical protein [Geobacter sp.]
MEAFIITLAEATFLLTALTGAIAANRRCRDRLLATSRGRRIRRGMLYACSTGIMLR